MTDLPPGALPAARRAFPAAAPHALKAALEAAAPHFDIEVDRAVLTATNAATTAERERIAAEIRPDWLEELADWFDTDDRFKVTLFPETWPVRKHEVQDDLRRCAAVLRGKQANHEC